MTHVVVIISPLVNLMKDLHVESLQKFGIPVLRMSDIADREVREARA